MAAIALDLTPVVDKLLERPFDRKTLDAASSAVDGQPRAYATALRCAAKRTDDRLAAAYWFAEAARVHETVDDLGGAIALLFRARECDPASAAVKEALAACMTKLAVRTGLSFTFSAGSDRAPATVASAPPAADDAGRPIPRESGLAPARPRDTLPDLFGIDATTSKTLPDTEWSDYGEVSVVAERPVPRTEVPVTRDSNPVVFPLTSSRRVEPMLPPSDPEAELKTLVPVPPPEAPLLRAVADIATPTRRSSELPPTVPPVSAPPPPLRTQIGSGTPPPSVAPPPPLARVRSTREDSSPSSPSPSSPVRIAPPPETDLVLEGPKTERPPGDVVVGALFEELHALHFLDDVRTGASFVAKVLAEHMGASTVLVHVYDINSRHFVVMSALGNRASALADYATPDDDAFVAELMKDGEAMVVLDPKDDPRFTRGRFLLVEPARSVACAPAVIEGRYLGLVEIVDPLDGSEFGEDDRNALAYAASAFARFLDRRGIVLSEEEDDLALPAVTLGSN